MMSDDDILARGGDERDIEEYAKQNGADMTTDPTMPERIDTADIRRRAHQPFPYHPTPYNIECMCDEIDFSRLQLTQSLLRESVMRKVFKAAQDLIKRMDEVHDHPHYFEVWQSYQAHGGDYSNGPKYDTELAKLEEAIAALSTTTPPTDRIVVTRKIIKSIPCSCVYDPVGKLVYGIQCPRCQLLAQFPSE